MSLQNADGDAQTLTEVDLFISTQRIKVLNADTQETMMDNALRTISYIADIGNIVVLMARRRMPRTASQDCIETTPGAPEAKKQYKMICHVFESEDAQLIAQSIGQAFSVAYQEFLRANGINPEDLSQKEYSDIINTQEMYNDDLIHFSNSENCKEVGLHDVHPFFHAGVFYLCRKTKPREKLFETLQTAAQIPLVLLGH
ncbi:Amyloid-beta A4 precursor protein-binding A member 2 [Characodon lateralis]|uniref:Amyloid-beta A4 protein-binding A member 2 n=2 Tax=Goodeidae TaxID=28758 RepID=A0ABU7DKJ7_9TELE|nr:Amyloid-beta A4 precursor protein-binding A member 2 [Characodon lateralis]